MSSIAGRAPIVDFDGTLLHLAVDWQGLRERLGVSSIDDLWSGEPAAWEAVTVAECAAAAQAPPLALMALLGEVSAFAVLTGNSEEAVRVFVQRFPEVAARLRAVVGRETLGGPKRDPELFAGGLRRCVRATADARGDEDLVYIGDAPWELELAAKAGARAVDVATLPGMAEGGGV